MWGKKGNTILTWQLQHRVYSPIHPTVLEPVNYWRTEKYDKKAKIKLLYFLKDFLISPKLGYQFTKYTSVAKTWSVCSAATERGNNNVIYKKGDQKLNLHAYITYIILKTDLLYCTCSSTFYADLSLTMLIMWQYHHRGFFKFILSDHVTKQMGRVEKRNKVT